MDIKALEDAVVESLRMVGKNGFAKINKRVNGVTTQIPAVWRARTIDDTGKVKPESEFPFATVSYTGHEEYDEILSKDWDEVTGEFVYGTEAVVRVNVQLVGSRQNPVDQLALKCHMGFEAQTVRDLIETSVEKCKLRNKSDILTSNLAMNNVYREMREFDLYFAMRKEVRLTPEEIGYFDSVQIKTQNSGFN